MICEHGGEGKSRQTARATRSWGGGEGKRKDGGRRTDKRLGEFGGQRDGTDTGFSPCTSGEDDDGGFSEESLPPRSIRGEGEAAKLTSIMEGLLTRPSFYPTFVITHRRATCEAKLGGAHGNTEPRGKRYFGPRDKCPTAVRRLRASIRRLASRRGFFPVPPLNLIMQ